jgi:hypothetical protein
MKDLTMTTFLGKQPCYRQDKFREHDLNVEDLPTPFLAPLLDLFPFLLKVPRFLFPSGGFWSAGQTYFNRNQRYWRWLSQDTNYSASRRHHSMIGAWNATDAFSRHNFGVEQAITITGAQLGSNFVVSAARNL